MIREHRKTPDEARKLKLKGTIGLFCEHPGTDRIGLPVHIGEYKTTWQPLHLDGTDGSIEQHPTKEMEFWLQVEDEDEDE